ncbi:MAG TPA: PrsW family glutamic-type intramembrane protease [Mycobacteriales bacterium]|nr:PrsW family glutamic-type intramembrane protease [Mycobacteriales bacterium]
MMPRDNRYRNVLLILVVMSLAYAGQLIVDICRPKFEGADSTIGLLGGSTPTIVRISVWWVFAGWGLAVLTGLVGLARQAALHPADRERNRVLFQGLVAGILAFSFTGYPFGLIVTNPSGFFICIPSTAFAGWVIYRMQRYRRMPARMIFLALAWGGLVGSGFGGSMNLWWMDYAGGFFVHSGNPLQVMHDIGVGTAVSAGISEELGKGAGIAILCILYRRYVDDVVSGIVLGATVGLGFNFIESIEYMGGGNPTFQYFARQSLGLMASHVAFSAVVGAGFGLARTMRSGRLVIGCAFMAAIGGHYGADSLLPYFAHVKQDWFGNPSDWVDSLVLLPMQIAVTSGPLVLMYLLWWRHGMREQQRFLAEELALETLVGFGGVSEAEVPVLLNPSARFFYRVRAFQHGGLTEYRILTRLYAAQLDLGTTRWHRRENSLDRFAENETSIRRRIGELRIQLAGLERDRTGAYAWSS